MRRYSSKNNLKSIGRLLAMAVFIVGCLAGGQSSVAVEKIHLSLSPSSSSSRPGGYGACDNKVIDDGSGLGPSVEMGDYGNLFGDEHMKEEGSPFDSGSGEVIVEMGDEDYGNLLSHRGIQEKKEELPRHRLRIKVNDGFRSALSTYLLETVKKGLSWDIPSRFKYNIDSALFFQELEENWRIFLAGALVGLIPPLPMAGLVNWSIGDLMGSSPGGALAGMLAAEIVLFSLPVCIEQFSTRAQTIARYFTGEGQLRQKPPAGGMGDAKTDNKPSIYGPHPLGLKAAVIASATLEFLYYFGLTYQIQSNVDQGLAVFLGLGTALAFAERYYTVGMSRLDRFVLKYFYDQKVINERREILIKHAEKTLSRLDKEAFVKAIYDTFQDEEEIRRKEEEQDKKVKIRHFFATSALLLQEETLNQDNERIFEQIEACQADIDWMDQIDQKRKTYNAMLSAVSPVFALSLEKEEEDIGRIEKEIQELEDNLALPNASAALYFEKQIARKQLEKKEKEEQKDLMQQDQELKSLKKEIQDLEVEIRGLQGQEGQKEQIELKQLEKKEKEKDLMQKEEELNSLEKKIQILELQIQTAKESQSRVGNVSHKELWEGEIKLKQLAIKEIKGRIALCKELSEPSSLQALAKDLTSNERNSKIAKGLLKRFRSTKEETLNIFKKILEDEKMRNKLTQELASSGKDFLIFRTFIEIFETQRNPLRELERVLEHPQNRKELMQELQSRPFTSRITNVDPYIGALEIWDMDISKAKNQEEFAKAVSILLIKERHARISLIKKERRVPLETFLKDHEVRRQIIDGSETKKRREAREETLRIALSLLPLTRTDLIKYLAEFIIGKEELEEFEKWGYQVSDLNPSSALLYEAIEEIFHPKVEERDEYIKAFSTGALNQKDKKIQESKKINLDHEVGSNKTQIDYRNTALLNPLVTKDSIGFSSVAVTLFGVAGSLVSKYYILNLMFQGFPGPDTESIGASNSDAAHVMASIFSVLLTVVDTALGVDVQYKYIKSWLDAVKRLGDVESWGQIEWRKKIMSGFSFINSSLFALGPTAAAVAWVKWTESSPVLNYMFGIPLFLVNQGYVDDYFNSNYESLIENSSLCQLCLDDIEQKRLYVRKRIKRLIKYLNKAHNEDIEFIYDEAQHAKEGQVWGRFAAKSTAVADGNKK